MNVSKCIKMYQNVSKHVQKFRTFVLKWGCRPKRGKTSIFYCDVNQNICIKMYHNFGRIILMFLFTYSYHRWRYGRHIIVINYRLIV